MDSYPRIRREQFSKGSIMASINEVAKSYIEKKIKVDENGCWIPSNKPRPNGYVRASFLGASWYMHRLSFNAFNGELDSSKDVCHRCDVRNCCNPEHLFQGTRKVNMQDAAKKGRQARGFKLPQTVMTEKDKECALYLIKKGCQYKDIAVLFKVTNTTIGRLALSNGIKRRSA